ncbi:MAG TPA: hypothetical protein DHD79_04445 [Firmicutes bacterium]|nr:hypothetical protein [Bacillota bacterium]HAZ21333.1 hypothetical protein [Bacillota bacterium]HBG43546.1 hypothetical protein [Bacillota bacterium]HBR24584.1 hypothetical protein [Bacillota bacterium]HCF90001.1 hypothetical protein [Bacillota bacterium]
MEILTLNLLIISRPATGRGGFLATVEVTPELREKGRTSRACRTSLKILVIGIAFAAFLIWGLTITEESVNHLMGRAADTAVFHIGKSPGGQLELILLGERHLGPSFTETIQTWKSKVTELLRLRPTTPAGEGEEVLK